jgi:hypothetical protein
MLTGYLGTPLVIPLKVPHTFRMAPALRRTTQHEHGDEGQDIHGLPPFDIDPTDIIRRDAGITLPTTDRQR